MSNLNIKIDPLGKDNFDTWKIQMEALLIKNGNWKYVSGRYKKPIQEDNDANQSRLIEEWKEEDDRAKADLILCISASQLREIKNCETSHELWLKLHNIYQSKGPAKKASLLKQLLFTKMKEEQNVKEHISKFMEIVDKLLSMELEINKELLVILLLYSLPSSYENFRCAIESRDELPSIEMLKIKILEFETRTEKDESGITYLAKSKIQKYKKHETENKYKNFQFTCHNCGKKGHKRADCRSPKGKNKNYNNKNESYSIMEKQNFENIEMECVLNGNQNVTLNKSKQWCLDSGCSSHMCFDENKFINNIKVFNNEVNLANKTSTSIEGKGNIKLKLNSGKEVKNVELNDVFYVPDLRMNLMSVSKITNHGYTVEFDKNYAKIKNSEGRVTTIARRKNDIYVIDEKTEEVNFAYKMNSIEDWHQRLGHINERSLMEMNNRNLVVGLNIKTYKELNPCETCIKSKITRKPFKTYENERTKSILEIIHSDICGPMRVSSTGGNKYFITFIDDKSRWCEIKFLKHKCEALEAFKIFKNMVETQTGRKIKCLQSDNGGEYCNKKFDDFLSSHGIKRRLSAPHTPQQQGLAERKNRTLVETARCLMSQSGLSQNLWAETINTANYIRNRIISRSIGNTPYFLWHGRKPTVSYFRKFGCKTFVLNKEPARGKFEDRAKECIFVGYDECSKAYRLWSPSEKRIIISRDVKFLEQFGNNEFEEFIEDVKQKNISQDETDTTNKDVSCEILLKIPSNRNEPDKTEDETKEILEIENTQDTETIINKELADNFEKEDKNDQILKRLPGRPKLLRTGIKGRPKKEFKWIPTEADENKNEFIGITEISHKEAFDGNERDEWKKAICEEFKAMLKNNTWNIVDSPDNNKEIKCRIILTNKLNLDGTIVRRKARLVAKGYSQEHGIDFFDTFAPVVRLKSVRLVMALAAQWNLTVHQLDIKTAYLNGDLEEKIFMKMPKYLKESLEEIVEDELENEEIITKAQTWLKEMNKKGKKSCLLKKPLYGLRQSARQWNKKLNEILQKLNMTPSKSDPCIYVKKEENDIILLTIFVDDIILAGNKISKINEFKKQLSEFFEVKDMGNIKQCLGIDFTQSEREGSIIMSQKHYIKQILTKFGMENCKPVKTPLESNCKLSKSNNVPDDKYPFQSLIGSLMYLAITTRPDITFAINYLSQFNNCYQKEHWNSAKRVLRYIKGTMDYKLYFKKEKSIKLTGFTDADWGSCVIDRKSYTGYVFLFAGTPISWEAKKQKTVALSSTEAEYMALAEGTKEAIYLQNLLQELGVQEKETKIYSDNVGAGLLVKNNNFHSRTKHIDIRHHFVRQANDDGRIKIEYISTDEMVADIFTKSLSAVKHGYYVRKLNLCL